MKRKLTLLVIVMGFISHTADKTHGWTQEEHRVLADSVYSSVMEVIGEDVLGSGTELNFAKMCTEVSRDDLALNRFHRRGKTVLDQLRSLSKEDLSLESGFDYLGSSNVVASYLRHHIWAFRAATGSDMDALAALNGALRQEAIAQSFLADAFSSGHMLVPLDNILARLARRNKIEAHHFHRNEGVYVINGNGDSWQAFGDELMHWYAPTYRAVLSACQTSFKEVLLVYCEKTEGDIPAGLRLWADSVRGDKTISELVNSWLDERDGASYLTDVGLPSLKHIPMPVAASWSYRTGDRDENSMRRHHHYLQLKDDRFHDPDSSDIDFDFLYARSSVPDFMIPPPLLSGEKSPEYLIKTDADWASVRWTQQRLAPPSYKGFLFIAGGQAAFSRSSDRVSGKIGFGYGIWDDLLLFKNLSLGLTLMSGREGMDEYYLLPNASLGLAPLLVDCFKAIHLEIGAGYRRSNDSDELGLMLASGIDSHVYPLGSANIGLTGRLKYEWIKTDPSLHGISLELILQ